MRKKRQKKRLKKQDWLYIMLFFVLFIPTAFFIGALLYAKAHPEGKIQILKSDQTDTLNYELDEDGKFEKVDSTLVLEAVEPGMANFSHWRGARTVVFFFSAACRHCRQAFPIFQALADSLANEEIQVVALAVEGNSHAGIQDFAKAGNSHLRLYHDEGRRFGSLFGFRTVPSILIVDAEGNYMKHSDFRGCTPKLIRKGLARMDSVHAQGATIGR